MAQAVYFDESGYTGKALLDPVQPLFCVASTVIDEREAEAILRRSFPNYAGQEFKFQQLWRRNATRGQLKIFSKEISSVKDRVFLWIIDKPFCVLTKIIDFLVEPVLHDRGRDFYKNGHAPKFSNYVHFGFTVADAPGLYEATLQTYYRFARDPSEERLRELQWRLSLMANSGPVEMRFFYEMASLGAREFHRHSDISTFKDTFEIQLSSVLASVGYWRDRLADDIELYHDASSNFFRQGELWAALTSPDVPPQLHPQANAPPIQFPLRVIETKAVESRESHAIQLCDAIAGLAIRLARKPISAAEEATILEIATAGFAELTFNGIRPGFEFPDGPPEPLDGPDAVDRLTAIVRHGRP